MNWQRLNNKYNRMHILTSYQSDILSKDAGHLPQVFFKHFASKNQLPGFYISGTLVKNGFIGPVTSLYRPHTKSLANSSSKPFFHVLTKKYIEKLINKVIFEQHFKTLLPNTRIIIRAWRMYIWTKFSSNCYRNTKAFIKKQINTRLL